MSLSDDKKRLVQPFCAFSVAAIMAISSLVSATAVIGTGAVLPHTPAADAAVTEEKGEACSKKIVLDVNGARRTVMFSGDTVEELLRLTRTEIGENQIVTPDMSACVTPYMTVTVRDAKTITLTADGKTSRVKLACGKLTESLRLAGVPLCGEDLLSVPRDSRVEDVDVLAIRRVTYRHTTETEPVPFRQTIQNTARLAAGTSKTKTQGEYGEKTVTKRVKFIDGEWDGETVVSEQITKQPVDEVILAGVEETM